MASQGAHLRPCQRTESVANPVSYTFSISLLGCRDDWYLALPHNWHIHSCCTRSCGPTCPEPSRHPLHVEPTSPPPWSHPKSATLEHPRSCRCTGLWDLNCVLYHLHCGGMSVTTNTSTVCSTVLHSFLPRMDSLLLGCCTVAACVMPEFMQSNFSLS